MEEAEEEEEEAAAAAAKQFAKLEAAVVVDIDFVGIITEKELVYRALLGDLLSPTQKAKLGAGDTAAAGEV